MPHANIEPTLVTHAALYCHCGTRVNCCFCYEDPDQIRWAAYLPAGHPESCERCREMAALAQRFRAAEEAEIAQTLQDAYQAVQQEWQAGWKEYASEPRG